VELSHSGFDGVGVFFHTLLISWAGRSRAGANLNRSGGGGVFRVNFDFAAPKTKSLVESTCVSSLSWTVILVI